MSGFNTKERNNNGEYEVTFYTDNYADFKTVENLCRKLIGHEKPTPEGDLISRNALKEEIVKLCERINANNGITVPTLAFTRIIDNAQAVDVISSEEGYEMYGKGYLQGYERGKSERPKGEWNYIQAGMCVCPFCGATPHKEYKDFCPKCGADMRKGENNEKL